MNATLIQTDAALVRSLTEFNTPLADILAGLRANGRTEQHIADVLAAATK